MRSGLAIVAVVGLLGLTGCVVRSKPQTVHAAPPAPQPAPTETAAAKPEPALSIPQTQVELPPAQPVNPEALQVSPPAEPTVDAPATMRRPAGPPPITVPKPVEAAAQPPAPAEAERAPVREIVPAGELKKLQDNADARKREVRQLLTQARAHPLNGREQIVIDNVESFLKLSDQAETRGDMRQASALAERAWVLAKDLRGGR